MVKLVNKQTSFNFGIITEKLKARDDLKQYPAAIADGFNFLASKYGPMQKRVGTLYKWNVEQVGKTVRLVPFVLSMRKTIVLEFLNNMVRFYTFNGQDFGPITDGQGNIYSIVSPYSSDMLQGLSYAQSLNVLYIAAPDGAVRPMELRRYADNNWAFVPYTTQDGPYLDQNFNTGKTVTPNTKQLGSINITASGFTFTQGDVGRHIRMNHPDVDEDLGTTTDRWSWGIIQSIGSNGTTASVYMYQAPADTSATYEWRLGAWRNNDNNTPVNEGTIGWPSHVTIHEQRLVWQGTTNYPWLWMSNSFNYYNYSPADYSGNVKDSNAICYNMATDKVAPVRWLASLGSLLIGTEMYEMRMFSAGAGLAPGDCVVRKESTYGVHDALPVITDDTLIFIQRLQRALRSVSYDYTRDAYIGPELSVLTEALTVEGLRKIEYQREPNATIWALLEDGTLLAITYDKEQDVTAWTRVEIAGKNAKVIDMVSMPSATFKQDMLILWVERKVNGQTVRYAEILSKEYLKNTPIKDVPFLDSSMRYRGSSTRVITGLDHLKGETVRMLDRGGIHQDAVVAQDGSVTFDYPVSDGWVGLPYRAFFDTLEREVYDGQRMSTKMSKVRIHRLTLYLIRTLGLTVKQLDRGIETELITFSPQSNMDTPPEPVTGQVEHDIMTAWTSSDLTYTLRFESEPGLPCTIGGIFAGVEVNAL